MSIVAHRIVRGSFRGPAALHLLVLCLLIGTLARPASGQAMPGMPDPMTSRELSGYVIWLEMSAAQVKALEPIHDAYLERFRRLREGDMQRLVDDVLALASNINFLNPQIPPRDDLEEIVRRADRLLRRIGQVDQSLFDEMSAILTEDQMLLLPRVRLARQRELYSEVAWSMGRDFNPGAGIDLSEMVRNLELDPDEFEQIDPVLAQYETQLSGKVSDLHQALLDTVPVILDTVDELGLRNMTTEQMMQMGQDPRLINRLKRKFDEASKPFQTATSALSKLNLNTFRRIEPLLSTEHREELRDHFYYRAYREVRKTDQVPRERFRRALEHEGLSTEVRDAIAAAHDSYVRADTQMVDSLASASEDRRAYRTVDQLSEEVDHPLDDKIADLRERRRALADNAVAGLESMLGPQLVTQLHAEQQQREAEWEAAKSPTVADGGSLEVAVGPRGRVTTTVRRNDDEDEGQVRSVVSDPMDSTFRDRLAGALAVSDDQRPLFDVLYDDYLESYEQFRNELGPMPERPADRMRVIEEAVARAHTIDERFFDDLGITFGPADTNAELTTLMSTRQRRVYVNANRGIFGGVFGGWEGGNESEIHLADLIGGLNDTITVDDSLKQVLAHNSQRVAEQQADVLSASMQLQRMQMVQEAAMRQRGGFRPGNSAVDQAVMKRFREAVGEVQTARVAQAEENRAALDEILTRLPAEQSWALRDAYNREAFPGIYNDGDSAEPIIRKAMMLRDLTDQQREGITELAASFRSRYNEISEQMIDLRRRQQSEATNFRFEQGEVPRDLIQRELSLEQLRFDRREASERAKMRLRVVLDEDQRNMLFPKDKG